MGTRDERCKSVGHPPAELSLFDELELDGFVGMLGCPACHGHMTKIRPGVYECTRCKCPDCGSPMMWDFWIEG